MPIQRKTSQTSDKASLQEAVSTARPWKQITTQTSGGRTIRAGTLSRQTTVDGHKHHVIFVFSKNGTHTARIEELAPYLHLLVDSSCSHC